MSRLLHPLFALLASATRQELARQVAYLKEENRILRSRLPGHISVTAKERQRLLKVWRKLGAQLRELISIVTDGSFLRWVREAGGRTAGKGTTPRKPGRPRTPDDIRELILKLARENPNTVPRAAPSRHRRSAFQTYNPLRGTIDPVAAGCQLFPGNELRNHEVHGEGLLPAHLIWFLVIEVIGDRSFEAAAGQDGPHRAFNGGRSGFRRNESITR